MMGTDVLINVEFNRHFLSILHRKGTVLSAKGGGGYAKVDKTKLPSTADNLLEEIEHENKLLEFKGET